MRKAGWVAHPTAASGVPCWASVLRASGVGHRVSGWAPGWASRFVWLQASGWALRCVGLWAASWSGLLGAAVLERSSGGGLLGVAFLGLSSRSGLLGAAFSGRASRHGHLGVAYPARPSRGIWTFTCTCICTCVSLQRLVQLLVLRRAPLWCLVQLRLLQRASRRRFVDLLVLRRASFWWRVGGAGAGACGIRRDTRCTASRCALGGP